MSEKLDSQIRLVVGLGNPGSEYRNTRHNAGFMIIDRLSAGKGGRAEWRKGFNGLLSMRRLSGREVILFKPMTYMNLSGDAVRALVSKNKIEPGEMLVVFDDLDLPPGRIRVRASGGSAGHRGVESIIDSLGTEAFPRLRVGIGRSETSNASEHVLGEFSGEEIILFDRALALGTDAVEFCLRRGVAKTMNKYNSLQTGLNEDNSSEENR